MASRHADSRNSRYDDDRGPRRSYGRRDDRRGARRDDRRDDRRDTDRYQPGRRRSRSPVRERRRSRDRVRDDRDRDRNRFRDDRSRYDRDRERSYRDRERDDRRRADSRERDRDGRRGSYSSASSYRPDGRAASRAQTPKISEEERKRLEDEETKKERQAKVAMYKEKMLKQKAKEAKAASDPNSSASANNSTFPQTTSIEHDSGPGKSQDNVSDKPKQKPAKSAFKLDDMAMAKATPTTSLGNNQNRAAKTSPATNNVAAKPLKASGNVNAFGLKAKSTTDKSASKNALFDDEEATQKRTIEKLPDFVPEDNPTPEAIDDTTLGDIGSDDEDAAALAAAEKRREEANKVDADVQMAESTNDDVQMIEEAEDIDPLDAFMSGLEPEPEAKRTISQGVAMFAEDNEVDMEAVDTEDLWAIANVKKKKKDVPQVDHEKVQYEPFRKVFYVEPSDVASMTPEEVADLRHELDGIKIKGDNVPNPVLKWGQMGLSGGTLGVINQLGYHTPTSIQAQGIPIAESGMDMVGIAKTGSGKTLAFGIPIIRHIMDQRPLSKSDGPICLILAPTRELVVQIVRELKPFLKAQGMQATCAYGGAPIKDQIADIRRGGIHLLCATPGRLIDLLTSNSGRILNFKRITYVVLDEADRMFDLGFEPQVMKILANIRPDRQTVLFSATFPKNMASLAKKILTKPAEVVVGGRSVVAPEITQIVKCVPKEKKMHELLLHLGDVISNDDDARALIFVEKQETAEELLKEVMRKGYPCNSIHGGKDQVDRTDAINDFKNGVLPILIATSVAARGLDIAQLKLVVNFDCPSHLEDYVHRCGRTGRAGNKGTAVTLLEDPGQERFAIHIRKALEQSDASIPPELDNMTAAFWDKVKAGTEKWSRSTGFGGKGLDKLDKEREAGKARERRAFGVDDDKESSDEEDDKAPVPPTPVISKRDSSAPAQSPKESSLSLPSHLPDLNAEVVVKKTERPADDPMKGLSAMERVKRAAAGIDGRLSKKGMIHLGQPIDNKGPDAGAFHATVEINDFPQKARWAVTNRTNVYKILEATGTSITTKGTYYPPGQQPKEGELPPLYILVEGETENVVSTAMKELYRLLKDGVAAASEETSRTSALGGRYKV